MNDEGKRPVGQKTPQPAADVEQVGILTRVSDGRQYSLGFGSLRVGRQRRADLVITDKTVSRHHADVCYEGGRYVLYDHSTNGTWINGTLVAVAQPLRNGDMVKFGKIEYRFNLKTVPADEAARAELQTSPERRQRQAPSAAQPAEDRAHGRCGARGRLAGDLFPLTRPSGEHQVATASEPPGAARRRLSRARSKGRQDKRATPRGVARLVHG
jgi:pSer/pThr/pTyr-binding forkhead associated (FHA) protein